jgi:hypothetical protein
VKTLVAELRAAFPLAVFSAWAPAEVHDQWQRIPLVPQLRAERVNAYRGEHVAPSRAAASPIGCAREWRGKRLLMVDRRAKLSLNALSTGYSQAVERGGRVPASPSRAPRAWWARRSSAWRRCSIARSRPRADPEGRQRRSDPGGIAFVSAHPQALKAHF